MENNHINKLKKRLRSFKRLRRKESALDRIFKDGCESLEIDLFKAISGSEKRSIMFSRNAAAYKYHESLKFLAVLEAKIASLEDQIAKLEKVP